MKKNISNCDSTFIYSNDINLIQKSIENIHYDIHKFTTEEKKTFCGASYDTVFTVTITILIFAIGILIDRRLKRINENSELLDLRKYFLDQLSDLTNRIAPILLKGYKQYYQKEISVDYGIPTTPPKILTNNLQRIRKMESEKLFKAIKPEEKNNFNKYFNEIDSISNLLNEVGEYHVVILKRSEIIRNKIAELDGIYMLQFLEFIRREKSTAGEDSPFYILAVEKLEYYNREIAGKRNLTKYYKNIIKPFQNQLVLHDRSQLEYVNNLIITGKFLINNYGDLRQLTLEVRLQYRVFSFVIDESLKKLKLITAKSTTANSGLAQ